MQLIEKAATCSETERTLHQSFMRSRSACSWCITMDGPCMYVGQFCAGLAAGWHARLGGRVASPELSAKRDEQPEQGCTTSYEHRPRAHALKGGWCHVSRGMKRRGTWMTVRREPSVNTHAISMIVSTCGSSPACLRRSSKLGQGT